MTLLRNNRALTLVSLLFIIAVTLLSRAPTLNRITHLSPFWSYRLFFHGNDSYVGQILLNIALFIPFGYYLSALFRSPWAIAGSFLTSATVESLQFATCRGMLDVDDLISNVIGGVLGFLLWSRINSRKSNKEKRFASFVLMSFCLIGCLIVAGADNRGIENSRITEQFNFDLESVGLQNDFATICGKCYVYGRPELGFVLVCDQIEIDTERQKEQFSATIRLPHEKVELQVRFKGYKPMPTGVWLCPDGTIDFVAENVENPEGVPEGAVLKAYSPEFDTYVYKDGDRLLWMVGWDGLDSNTEIIYHIHTNEPEKLPEHRKQYGFDNVGFWAKDNVENASGNELESLGRYRVFERRIPKEYNVTAISVGFNTDDEITWWQSFRP